MFKRLYSMIRGGEGKRKNITSEQKPPKNKFISGQDDRVGKCCAHLLPQPPQNYNYTTKQPSLRIV